MTDVTTNIINKNLKLKKITDPYNIWIIDNCFDSNIISQINEDWPRDYNKHWYNTRDKINASLNILEHGVFGINDIQLMPRVVREFFKKINSQTFVDELVHILNIEPLVLDYDMRWSGMRSMLQGSYQLIHSDARQHVETKYTKHLTCLLYLNENYNKDNDEGCLEIWDDKMETCCYEIEPIANRFVVFENSDTSYHGVPCVKSERRMLTCSILKKEYVSARSKALFVRRPTDSIEVENISKYRLNEVDISHKK